MTIKIEYNMPEEDVLEIRFIRGRNMIHNAFYNIQGLSDSDVLELKKEAASKFCAVFPDVPLKSVLQGFKVVDPLMREYYKQTFPNGGWRGGGRPKGTKGTKKNGGIKSAHNLRRKRNINKNSKIAAFRGTGCNKF